MKTPLSTLYQSHMNLIYKKAFFYHSCYPLIEFDEFVSAGNFAFIDAAGKFDQSRGVRFSTYLWRALDNHMRRLIKDWFNNKQRFTPLDDNEDNIIAWPSVLESLPVHDEINLLSDRAKEVIDILYNIPNEIIFTSTRGRIKKLIKQQLQQRGWCGYRIKTTFREIKLALVVKSS